MAVDIGYSVAALIIVALVTWLTRALPYLLFGGKKELPRTICYLGNVLPASIMVILVIYCLRNTDFCSMSHGIAELLSVVVVIAAQIWKKNTILSILLGTTCYMLLIRTAFPV